MSSQEDDTLHKSKVAAENPADPVSAFSKLFEIVKILRSPSGCPWDRKQTVESLLPHVLEETYEAIDAVRNNDTENLSEEIGDLYLLVTMISYILEQTASVPVTDTINGISDKLVRRHPHVFGDISVDNADEVLEIWNNVKTTVENRSKKDSVLDSLPLSLPPLERAHLMQKKAAKYGFDWPDSKGVFKKIHEEIDEFGEAVDSGDRERISGEFGDILFSLVNAARFSGINPVDALHRTNQKFLSRFRYIESRLREEGKTLEESSLEEMDRLWDEAKNHLTDE